MKDNYVAHFFENGESETFETFEEAEKWLNDIYEDYIDEGYSEETIGGCDYIAKITHRSKFTKTDNKNNYHEHNENCPKDCGLEEWPYDNDFDFVGEVTLEKTAQPAPEADYRREG